MSGLVSAIGPTTRELNCAADYPNLEWSGPGVVSTAADCLWSGGGRRMRRQEVRGPLREELKALVTFVADRGARVLWRPRGAAAPRRTAKRE